MDTTQDFICFWRGRLANPMPPRFPPSSKHLWQTRALDGAPAAKGWRSGVGRNRKGEIETQRTSSSTLRTEEIMRGV